MSKPKRPRTETPSILGGEQRINKLLAAAGLGSRRQVDELITDGRVEIDGKTVTQVGIKVDAEKSKISVDGEPLKRHRPLYFAVHKPAGVLCTNRDPEGRPRVIDLVPGNNRLFPVGRLDASSTGLILLTNDGELAQRLAHPRHSVPKNYFVVVAGQVEPEAMRRLQRGIYLAEGLARVDGAKVRKVRKGCTEIEITLSEGKNREIRRVLARLGHRVVTLRRLAIGPLKLATLPEGSFRPLTPDEVAALYQAVEDIKREKKADRKERDKRRSAEMNSMEPALADSAVEAASGDDEEIVYKKNNQKTKKKSKKESEGSWDEQADALIEKLPPLSANPFRQSDDDDNVIDPGFEDSILVRDAGPVFETSTRRGKVLGYSESESASIDSGAKGFEDDEDDDDLDSTGMGVMQFDDEDDDDDDNDIMSVLGGIGGDDDEDLGDDDIASESDESIPSNSPWSKIAKKPRAGGDRPRSSNTPRKSGPRSSDAGDRPRRPAGDRQSAGPGAPRRRSAAGNAESGESSRTYQPRRGRGRPASTSRPTGDIRHETSGHSTNEGQMGSDGPPIVNRRAPRGDGRSSGEARPGGYGRPPAGGRPTGRRSSGPGRPTTGSRPYGDSDRGGPTGSREGGPREGGARPRSGPGGKRATGGRREGFGGDAPAAGGDRGGRSGRPYGGGGGGASSGPGKRSSGKRSGGKPFGSFKGRKGGGKGRSK
jgi:23S rRNA pseudouridine2605 synthase